MRKSSLVASLVIISGLAGCDAKPKKSSMPSSEIEGQQSASDPRVPGQGADFKQGEDAADADAAAEQNDALMATEPVPIAGAYLVCLEERKPQATAMCRLENKTGVKMDALPTWKLTFYVQTPKDRITLVTENLGMENAAYDWRVALGKYKLVNMMLEIYDTEKGLTNVTAAIPLDPRTMKPMATRDPRAVN